MNISGPSLGEMSLQTPNCPISRLRLEGFFGAGGLGGQLMSNFTIPARENRTGFGMNGIGLLFGGVGWTPAGGEY
jgi:hypothetical protein